MKEFLMLRINMDNDGSGELFANFESDGFTGKGSAYFDLASLMEKAKGFAEFPFQKEGGACIEGGYLERDDYTKIRQEHLHISARPINSSGHLILCIRVAEPYDDQSSLRKSASVEFVAGYEQMREFSENLISLIRGNKAEIFFDGSVKI